MPQRMAIAHRGWSAKFPENTLLAFREAINIGADAIEFDVHQTRDGHLVVIHDGDVSRTTNSSGQVAKLTLTEIRALDAGNGERVPTLREVLELGKGRTKFHLEIKAAGVEGKVLATLHEVGVFEDTYFSSFIHAAVAKVKVLNADADIAALESTVKGNFEHNPAKYAREFVKRAKKLRAAAVHLNYANALPEVVQHLHENGLRVNVWTVDSEILAEDFYKMGVDGIFSNRIDMLLGVAKRFTGA